MNGGTEFLVRKHKELGVALNDVQKQAVLNTEGPMLLLASPGSGKTTTIIMRIGYLVEEKGVDPSRIKAVTFSRASANDMKERYRRFFPELAPAHFSTIHSLAFGVVREYCWRRKVDYQIIEGDVEAAEELADGESEAEGGAGVGGLDSPNGGMVLHKKWILRRIYQSVNGEHPTEDQMDELTTYISYIKNKLLPEDQWSQVKCDVPQAERILQDYEAFKKTGTAKRLMDYDDMLVIGNEILDRAPELLQKIQRRYDYVLTDESQDTSLVQFAIIEKLVRPHENLCVVADDDQSIYSWRGAEPSYLLHFRQVYPEAELLFMEQNYRSTRTIVDLANQFIKRNKNRYNKNMFTANGDGSSVQIKSFPDYRLQAAYLVEEAQKQENLREMAILYRNNSASVSLMNRFDRAGIPFYMKDADNRFFSHWVVEDVLNLMRMTFNDRRPDLLEKIHQKISGYISKQQMAAVKQFHRSEESVFDTLLKRVRLETYQTRIIQTVQATFERMTGSPPLVAIKIIRNQLGYEKALEKMCERLGFRKEYLIGILNTLEEIADTLDTMEAFAARLKHLEAALRTSKLRRGENAVTFSTFHSAKGLEFERVYMIDLVDGILPSKEDTGAGEGSDKLEEAVRLFYVGMTRAKGKLELLTYKERDGSKAVESPFVIEVRQLLGKLGRRDSSAGTSALSIRHAKELITGKAVRHRVFGQGVILKVGEERVVIRFDKQEKELLLQTCIDMGLLEAVVG